VSKLSTGGFGMSRYKIKGIERAQKALREKNRMRVSGRSVKLLADIVHSGKSGKKKSRKKKR